MLHALQHLVMPGLMFGAPTEMYVRAGAQNVCILLNDRRIDFRPGGRAGFDTFFNGFTIGTWRKHCALDDLYLVLRGSGRFVLRFGLHRLGQADRWLDERVIELQAGEALPVALDCWGKLDSGMLFFSLEALERASLLGGCLATTTPPVNRVRLGIVITHFNRKQYVVPAIERIRDELLSDPAYRGKIELVVVDNSKNITREEAEGASLIPNRNLGGSGGFMRGLLHLKDAGSFTHCLFMDDDASCEIESIRRAFSLLCYARTPRFAVAGSLMRELEPFRLFEKGAAFDGVCESLKSGLDMRFVPDLLHAEFMDKAADYGAWWFFAFAISDVRRYAFPFFVRGDDMLFGVLNKFDIATLNGIGCWGEDFGVKSSPMTKYLDVRSHAVQWLASENISRWIAAKLLFQFFAAPLFSFNYSSARAARISVAHVLQGRDLWVDNMDMTEIRALIDQFAGAEKMRPLARHQLPVQYPDRVESKFGRCLRIATLNGFLLPSMFLRSGVVFQAKGFRAVFREIFLYKTILYEYEPASIGYLARHSKRAFFAELTRFTYQLLKLFFSYGKLKKKYAVVIGELTSERFWREVYADALPAAVAGGPAGTVPPDREGAAPEAPDPLFSTS